MLFFCHILYIKENLYEYFSEKPTLLQNHSFTTFVLSGYESYNSCHLIQHPLIYSFVTKSAGNYS